MSKFYASLALLSLLSGLPALAADTSSTADTSKKTETAASAPADKSKKHDHDHPVGHRAVLGLSSLTDKQKEQINAVYDANKAKFDDLKKQESELMKDEWAKIKPVLTADQLTELRQERREHKRHDGGGAGKAAGAGKSAPADSGADKSSQ